jgi:type I restriction-modification system DNA methylase subunit
VFSGDDDALAKPGVVRSIYDPTAGTGGFLSCGMEYLHELNPAARLATFGQELNPESYAICKADMLIKVRTSATSNLAIPFPMTSYASTASITASSTRHLVWTGKR